MNASTVTVLPTAGGETVVRRSPAVRAWPGSVSRSPFRNGIAAAAAGALENENTLLFPSTGPVRLPSAVVN